MISKHLNLILSAALLSFVGCTQSPLQSEDEKSTDSGSDETNLTMEESQPEDSTGTAVAVTLDMQSSNSAALWLEGDEVTETPEAAKELKISDAITLSMARFNIRAIKVKSKKDQSDKEKLIEKKEHEEDAAELSELEPEDGANLNGKKDPGENVEAGKKEDDGDRKHHAMKDKIKEKRDHFKKNEDEQKERSKNRDKSTKFHGPYVYDAIAGAIEGDAPTVDLNDGSYRRIEFKLKRNVTAADDDPILGNVFVIQGMLKKSAESEAVPFEISWHSSMNFRLKGDKAYQVEAEGDSKLSIVFDLTKWFDGVDLTAAEADADGTIYINKNSNKTILKALRKNIKVNTKFGKDKDGNGKLEDAETAGTGEATADSDD